VQRVFIGDVQGCADELELLLERAASTYGEGHEIWLVGDLVNRGPASLRVLRQVRELVRAGRARCVLGNHELSLISAAWGLRERRPSDTFEDVLEAPDAEEWVDWVRALPLVETGQLGAQPFAMVHAAAHPDWTLADLRRIAARIEARLRAGRKAARAFLASDPASDPDREALALLTSCRSIARDGRWSTEPPAAGYVAWHREWSARAHAYGVVYGHWSMQGLHLDPWLRGIDTGCVHDGRGRAGYLTAWIPDPSKRTPFDVPDDRFWQQRALAPYYREVPAR
jgi:bis(5'-nucleosyl)-tetraphosphatase (symmetrical)